MQRQRRQTGSWVPQTRPHLPPLHLPHTLRHPPTHSHQVGRETPSFAPRSNKLLPISFARRFRICDSPCFKSTQVPNCPIIEKQTWSQVERCSTVLHAAWAKRSMMFDGFSANAIRAISTSLSLRSLFTRATSALDALRPALDDPIHRQLLVSFAFYQCYDR